MGDVTLYHEPIMQAIDEMEQATKDMYNALENFIGDVNQLLGLAPEEEGMAGLTTSTWQSLQEQINNKINDMNSLFGMGSPTLQQMIDLIHAGDKQGANIIGSGTG